MILIHHQWTTQSHLPTRREPLACSTNHRSVSFQQEPSLDKIPSQAIDTKALANTIKVLPYRAWKWAWRRL